MLPKGMSSCVGWEAGWQGKLEYIMVIPFYLRIAFTKYILKKITSKMISYPLSHQQEGKNLLCHCYGVYVRNI